LVHEVSRAEELTKRRRAKNVDHVGLEVEEHHAGSVLSALGLVVKYADATELRVVAATVLAFTADAVLVAHHLQRPGAHLVTTLARLHVKNLARRSRLEARSAREKKGGKERKKLRNSVWKFGTGNRKYRWCARVYPERESEVVLPL
jgi:hypothetical protein